MSSETTRSCLVVTYGPVPTPQYQTIEGGGMRAWGLARGLHANGVDVTVAVHHSFPQELAEHDGIRLANWDLNDDFARLINSFDSVLISYCMGDPSVFVEKHINDDVQLILDAYVPIYVEVSARDSEDIDNEYASYMAEVGRFNKVLRRGDYVLCANQTQKAFYTGVLSSLGLINPRSYREDRIVVVPFGIHNEPAEAKQNPYESLGIKDSDFTVMWFGGLYPWFHVEELLNAILELSKTQKLKFVFVGSKNPFNPNPDFFRQHDLAVEFANKHRLMDKSVFFVEWVDFDERISYYKHADLVISLNKPGEENRFSWRTRVMDYVWGELAILTNGGDPLSDDLVAAGAAANLPELSASAITKAIKDLMAKPAKLKSLRDNITTLKPTYHWDHITQPVAKLIDQAELPYRAEKAYQKQLGLHHSQPDAVSTSTRRNPVKQLPEIVRKVRRKGVVRSAKVAVGIAKTQLKKTAKPATHRRYVFISHPINNTGAPLVLVQIVEEFAKRYGAANVQLVAPGIEPDVRRRLSRIGIKIDHAVFGLGFRFIRAQLALRPDDFVLMNTAAVYDNYRDFIMLWLRNSRLKHAYWFIHEDLDQLPYIHKEFLDKQNLDQTHKLLESGKLTLLTPSMRTKQEYDRLLKPMLPDKIRPINLHVEVDDKYKRARPAKDYSAVDFLLSGIPTDGRKGHLLALSAFSLFLKDHYEKKPEQYRDFKLHLLAVGDDYISQQIRWVGESSLGHRLAIYPIISKDEALDVTSKCNAVICCSLNETFALYVAESMFMGHVVLRNNSAGVDEQLQDGVNGYLIDHTDIKQFAAVIEKILNKETNSDKQLQSMGAASQAMIASYSRNTYLEQLMNLDEA
jgi:glycosyltransferase involved in cell wall biosynthesis